MSSSYSLAGKAALLSLLARFSLAQSCITFGMDFQDGGSYFQNSLSSDPFTFVSEFEGCQNDTANNILVDPTGNQYLCTDTNLTPDDTAQLSTCPLDKNQLSSGPWSVLVLSNNGNGDPIAYERDFSLSVGPQATTTFTPTVTVPITSTPAVNTTTIITDVSSTTLTPVTTTVPSATVSPTRTVTPSRVTVTSTKALYTINRVKPTVEVLKSTKVVTASCRLPQRPTKADKKARITPTVGSIKALPTKAGSAKFRLKDRDFDMATFLRERDERLAAGQAHVIKRAPDAPTLTITDTNTADYPTVTSTSIAPTNTATVTSTFLTTTTITPSPVTLISGQSTLSVVTITAPTPTRSVVRYAVATNYSTKTYTFTVTITSKTTPAATATACKKAGGILY